MQLTDPQLLQSLARLDKNPDFARFRTEYLDGLLAEATQDCIESEQPARAQGAALLLQQIERDLKGAEEAFYKVTQTLEIPLS